MTTGILDTKTRAHTHYYVMEPSGEKYIQIGRCSCGDIKYFANVAEPDIMDRVHQLNNGNGRLVMNMLDTDPAAAEIEAPPCEVKPNDIRLPAELPPVPPRPEGGAWYRHNFYKANFSLFKQYVDAIGLTEACNMWGMSFHVRKTMEMWLRDGAPAEKVRSGRKLAGRKQKTARRCAEEVINTPPVARSGKMPVFPAFDSSWPEAVQIRWLEVYRDLFTPVKG